MKYCFITFRSVTFGQQGERLMQRNGIQALLQRTPNWMEQRGCGYCLRMKERDIAAAVQLLRENRVDFRRVYQRTEEGKLEELAL